MDFKKSNKKTKTSHENTDEPTTAMIESLPLDLAIDIVSRLPITSLIRLRFASRTFQILSNYPHLAELQYYRTSKNNPCLMFHSYDPIHNQLCFAELSDHNNQIVRKLSTPFSNVLLPEFNIIGSCNGLLCLSDNVNGDTMYICNPFTREFKELPRTIEFGEQKVVCGFGFDHVSHVYKVVKVIYYWKRHNKNPPSPYFRIHNYRARSEVFVYSSWSPGWRSLGRVHLPHKLEQRSSEALVNGRLHWLTLRHKCESRYARSIVSFDLGDEKFREVPRPGGQERCDYHLTVLRKCLSVAFCNYEDLEIWVMRVYDVKESWIKEYNIGTSSVPRVVLKPELKQSYAIWRKISQVRPAQVLCLLKNGNVLVQHRGRVLMSYDPESGKFEKLMFQGMPELFQTIVHFGSLA
ncbi:F-box protein [Camellia lanceoleosa]|uniref:F-box protein n=1 Tax=Camellia lanceoleosa TaxID=1840588 RepID=A0ACC0HDG4_9ERIC|nr:F-box protein [Camellia lanceoleosa]